MAAPGAHFAPAVQNGHCLHSRAWCPFDVVVQLEKIVAHALHIVDEVRELAGQFQVSAVADAVDGLAQDGAPRVVTQFSPSPRAPGRRPSWKVSGKK